jgi:predicted ribosome quality control (RQC) complex YloA/Tae2 family protein
MDQINWGVFGSIVTAMIGVIFGYRFNNAYASEKLELARKLRSEKATEDVKRLMLIMDTYKDELKELRREIEIQKSSAKILINVLENKNRKLDEKVKELQNRISVLETENNHLKTKIKTVL